MGCEAAERLVRSGGAGGGSLGRCAPLAVVSRSCAGSSVDTEAVKRSGERGAAHGTLRPRVELQQQAVAQVGDVGAECRTTLVHVGGVSHASPPLIIPAEDDGGSEYVGISV
jgi:hypothetical protein